MSKKVNDEQIREYTRLLDDFHINITHDIKRHMKELYPNDIAMENYSRDLIMKKLGD